VRLALGRRALGNVRPHKSTASTASLVSLSKGHLPPLPVRAAIVGSSVGLGTPLFAMGGVGFVWFNYLPKTAAGQVVKYIVGLVIGGGAIELTWNYIGPFLRDHSELVLPFALSNGISSAFWYTVAELTLGLDTLMLTASAATLEGAAATASAAGLAHTVVTSFKSGKLLSRLPVAGAVVGTLTALTSPLIWP